ncbi:MAG: DUF423 domain-containing protein [Bacteroidota bacterium]|nr:DUF423 domain-containing protein [Bacteroidota bacterium]
MKNYIVFFFILLGLSVLLAALGSHFIYEITEDEELLSLWTTTVNYQIYHSLGGILMLLVFKQCNITEKWPVNLLIAGIIFFCGFFYVKTGMLLESPSIDFEFLRNVRPIGGLLFVAGWFSAAGLVNHKIRRQTKRDGGRKSKRKK